MWSRKHKDYRDELRDVNATELVYISISRRIARAEST